MHSWLRKSLCIFSTKYKSECKNDHKPAYHKYNHLILLPPPSIIANAEKGVYCQSCTLNQCQKPFLGCTVTHKQNCIQLPKTSFKKTLQSSAFKQQLSQNSSSEKRGGKDSCLQNLGQTPKQLKGTDRGSRLNTLDVTTATKSINEVSAALQCNTTIVSL